MIQNEEQRNRLIQERGVGHVVHILQHDNENNNKSSLYPKVNATYSKYKAKLKDRSNDAFQQFMEEDYPNHYKSHGPYLPDPILDCYTQKNYKQ